jgi:hypothetical protein
MTADVLVLSVAAWSLLSVLLGLALGPILAANDQEVDQ